MCEQHLSPSPYTQHKVDRWGDSCYISVHQAHQAKSHPFQSRVCLCVCVCVFEVVIQQCWARPPMHNQ